MNDATATWLAPAKLNLFLSVVGQRPDGYHLLQSVFQFIDLSDELIFCPDESNAISFTTDAIGLNGNDNLVERAAKMLRNHCGTQAGMKIHLKKVIPMGAGLGGGSSDAATTLIALNQLWDCGLDRPALMELGRQLGADVPIFIFGQAAWAEGIGEILTGIELPEPWYLVINPRVHVSTAEIFRAPELTRDEKPIKIRDFLEGHHANSCLPVVTRRFPEVGSALQWLNNFVEARLTGTGGCVFGQFDSQDEARSVLNLLPERWQGHVVKGHNRSPVYSN